MKIQIDGAGLKNKGAGLMLYAVLEQIEQKFPDATIYYNSIYGKKEDINTNLNIKQRFILKHFKYGRDILSHLGISSPIFTQFYATQGIDLLFDTSGFRFGDQWDYTRKYLNLLEKYYKRLKQNNTKTIMLPQAFGPFNTDSGKRSAEILNNYFDLIIARDFVSLNYLLEAGINKNRVILYPDFTITVKGLFPNKYESLKNSICIIPNKKMITHTHLNSNDYFSF